MKLTKSKYLKMSERAATEMVRLGILDPESQPEFKVGDMVWLNPTKQAYEIVEHSSSFPRFSEYPINIRSSSGSELRTKSLDCRLATETERVEFLAEKEDRKWSRKIGDVKVRAFYNISKHRIYFLSIPDDESAVNRAICKALNIPICDGEPCYPLGEKEEK